MFSPSKNKGHTWAHGQGNSCTIIIPTSWHTQGNMHFKMASQMFFLALLHHCSAKPAGALLFISLGLHKTSPVYRLSVNTSFSSFPGSFCYNGINVSIFITLDFHSNNESISTRSVKRRPIRPKTEKHKGLLMDMVLIGISVRENIK